MKEEKQPRKQYVRPVVTRVKLEDKRVVAMAVCKDDPNNQACAQDRIPTFDINPS